MKEGFSVLKHIESLRWALVRSMIVVLAVSGVAYYFSEKILLFLSKPVGQLYFFAPPEAFWVKLKLSFLTGVIVAAPYILAEAWCFVAPALKRREWLWGLPLVVLAIIMFYAGSGLALFLVAPFGIRFLSSFGGAAMNPFFGASGYINFVTFLVLSFGVLFETPIVMVILTAIGLLNPRSLARKRSYVIVAAFIVAAVLTPTVDFVTQIALALPLILLFEMGLLLSWLVYRQRNR